MLGPVFNCPQQGDIALSMETLYQQQNGIHEHYCYFQSDLPACNAQVCQAGTCKQVCCSRSHQKAQQVESHALKSSTVSSAVSLQCSEGHITPGCRLQIPT